MGKWMEKMDHPSEVVIKEGPDKWNASYGGSKMLIGTPRAVEKLVKTIPDKTIITSEELRTMLAEDYGADYACPLTTGIFLNIVAKAAEEQREAGEKDITPYWRVVKTDYSLNPKYPGGIEAQAKYLEKEGFIIVPKGKKSLKVSNPS